MIGEGELSNFRSEMQVVSNIKAHPNLIQILGICTSPLCIVSEFCSHGSLDKLLRNPSFVITQPMIYKWVRGIVAGLYHLSKEGVTHRDLAARNIMMDDNLRPKVRIVQYYNL